MDDLFGKLGNEGIARLVGEKVGDAVEGVVKNVMSGNKKEGDAAAEGSSDNKGGFDAGDVLSLVGGGKKEEKGGFDAGDVLSLVGGGKKEEKGGFDAGDVLSLVGGGKKEDEGGAGLSNVLGLFK